MKYEYNAVYNPKFLGDALLNRLGEQGWELVSHAYNSNTCDHFYTFKREKIDKPESITDNQTYDGVKAKTFIRDEFNQKIFKLDDSFKKQLEEDEQSSKWRNMFWENPIMYAKLENMIIEWAADPTKTAGELTRGILKLIK